MTRKKMLYPKNRRTPVKHKVKGYTRKDGTKIKGHTRGRGTRSQKPRRSRVIGAPKEDIKIHGYVVNFKYSDRPGDGESVLAISDQKRETIVEDYKEIMDEAFEERVDTREPISIEIVDPSFDEVIKIMSKKVKDTIEWGKPKVIKAAKIGAEYGIKATMIAGSTAKKVGRAGYDTTKELARLSAFAVEKELIHNLLKLCYQKDRAKRLAARAALKKRYPEIYDMTDFSRESPRRSRRRVPELVRLPKRYKSQAVV